MLAINRSAVWKRCVMNLSLRQLRAFAWVAHHQSVTLAAREMHLTQSAVSMLLQQLEQQVQLPLFERKKGRMELTPAGVELLAHARRVLSDVQHMEQTIENMQRLRCETLKIAVPQLLACTWFSRAVERFGQQQPGVSLTLVDGTADEVLNVVERGEADIGIGPERPVTAEVQRIFLAEVPMVLVFAHTHAYAHREAVAWSELRGENWIAYSSDFNLYLEKIFERNRINLSQRTVTQVNHLTTALALVGQGMGVTVVPIYATQLAGSFGLKHLQLHSPKLVRDFFIYHKAGALLSPAAQLFCKSLGNDLQGTVAA